MNTIVGSEPKSLEELFSKKYTIDLYQREYVWQDEQINDLICDLSEEFLKNWKEDHTSDDIEDYQPYFLGEIIVSTNKGNKIIDGQQRMTTLTLLLIYILRNYEKDLGHVKEDIEKMIRSNYHEKIVFNLNIEERHKCMLGLLQSGKYDIPLSEMDNVSIYNLVARYESIKDNWNTGINEKNIQCFTYWLKEKIIFSMVTTTNDNFAYVIFETMNDRGLSLTQVEMLRSYILTNIPESKRKDAMQKFDNIIARLIKIKLSSKSKAEFEFFKLYFRTHALDKISQTNESDFAKIGKGFYRWFKDNHEAILPMIGAEDFVDFLEQLSYFSNVYESIYQKIEMRDVNKYFYLIVNSDYGLTLQPALILAAIKYNDSSEIIEKKIQLVSKYLTMLLTWRVWNQMRIHQSAMESIIYGLCEKVSNMDLDLLKTFFETDFINESKLIPKLENAPILNQSNKTVIRVMLALITEIIARESNQSAYLLNQRNIEIEHIWANHFEDHLEEFEHEDEFQHARDTIGDLLLLPKKINSSYSDRPYKEKLPHYYEQNILAQTLNVLKYENNPAFLDFVHRSGLNFKPYEDFNYSALNERTELYKAILKWNWEV